MGRPGRDGPYHTVSMPSLVRLGLLIGGAAALLQRGADEAFAHGAAPEPLTVERGIGAWSLDPVVVIGLAVAVVAYLGAVRSVDRAHPSSPVPARRLTAWLAGLVVVAVALTSAVEVYATTLFSVHMVQHLLLTMVAAPLLALGAPVTLLLRLAPTRVRRGLILPILHSRPLRALSFPVVSWLIFAGVMWASHFSPLFDAALESPLVHLLEHALFLGSGLLFWWPAVGADPSPWRLKPGARIGYLALGMPQNTFLGLAIYSAPGVLYPHYATIERAWGLSALADQQIAGGLMWAAGDVLFLVPLVAAIAAWLRAEEARGARLDAQLDAQLARRR